MALHPGRLPGRVALVRCGVVAILAVLFCAAQYDRASAALRRLCCTDDLPADPAEGYADTTREDAEAVMGKSPAQLKNEFRNRVVGYAEVDPSQLLANPLNFRMHPDGQQHALAGAIDSIGYIDPVLVNKRTDTVIDGHLRVVLAMRSGVKLIPVTYVDLDDNEESLALLTLDPIAAMAASDKELLDDLLHSVNSNDERVQEMLADLAKREGIEYGAEKPEDPGPQIDKAEELRVKWGVESGQLWQLGEHRLICGDCTDRAVVERVMGGEKAGAVVTDPPYGINREGIENDSPEGLRALFDGCLSVCPAENAVIVAFQSPRLFPVWLDAIRAHGHKFERMLWMYKPNDETFPWRGWLQKSEAILLSSVGKPEFVRVDPFAHDVYSPTTLGKELDKTEGWHASVKPLAVVQDLISRIGGAIVYEPFAGSGTSLIACERLNRKCRAIEISPGYVGVAIERWVDMTGGEPVKIN